jgi:hypothetical protein
MITARKPTLVMALLLGTAPAALAQSAYTTGTITNSVAAGYPLPYAPEAVSMITLQDFEPAVAGGIIPTCSRLSARRHDQALYDMMPSGRKHRGDWFEPRVAQQPSHVAQDLWHASAPVVYPP